MGKNDRHYSSDTGIYADALKSFKTHSRDLDHLAEVSAIVNSRPLVPISTDPESSTILTLATLLTQKLGTVPNPPEDSVSGNKYQRRWKYVQHLANCFWNRWKREYLTPLQKRRKWQQVKPNFQVGDIILMKDQKEERSTWPMGLISKTFPSDDGKVDFPSPTFDVVYKSPDLSGSCAPMSMETLEKESKSRLQALITRESPTGMSQEDRAFVWEKRAYCHLHKDCLPKILASAPKWNVAYLREIYALIHSWPPLTPVCALELLNSRFTDQVVRSAAVGWIQDGMSDDELVDLLPQFVQAIKFEIHLDSDLVRFLLRRALGSVRVAHHLYW
ncbi:unnamed protein product [Ranitomeya imitator]|uniref:PIK helical domain-containing protein n=1 Tax=Ranitomeya imitator TaxID=111125 RepID=A0ABN9L8E6_9NEOB|nr:unnamed protein product [Ranitomeya imitator]